MDTSRDGLFELAAVLNREGRLGELRSIVNQASSKLAIGPAGVFTADAACGAATAAEYDGEKASAGSDPQIDDVDQLMRYQPWNPQQTAAGDEIRDMLTVALKTILRRAPAGRFRSNAVQSILDARMHANAAITFGGRF